MASELGLWLPAAGVCGKPEYESAQPSLAQDEEPNRQRDRGSQSHSSACSGTVSRGEKGEILSEELPGEPRGQKEHLWWLFYELPM